MRSAPDSIDDPRAAVPKTTKPHWSAKLVAWVGFVLGSAVSVAANVLSTWLPTLGSDGRPVPRADDWSPELAPQLGAAVWPVALLVSVEVLSRVPWPNTAAWNWARYGGTGAVAVGSGVISYFHLRDLLLAWGYGGFAASFGPAVVDGLMIVSGFALLAMSRQAAERTPDLDRTGSERTSDLGSEVDAGRTEAGPTGPEVRTLGSGEVRTSGPRTSTARGRTSRVVRAVRTGPGRDRTVNHRTSTAVRTSDLDLGLLDLADLDRASGPLDPKQGPDLGGGQVRRSDRGPGTGPRGPRSGPGQAAPTGPTGPEVRTPGSSEVQTSGPRTSTGPGRTVRSASTEELTAVAADVLAELRDGGARINRSTFAAALRARHCPISTTRAGQLLRMLTERQLVGT